MRIKTGILAGSLCISAMTVAYLLYLIQGVGSDMDAYFRLVGESERRAIHGLPIYEDFVTREKEEKLRTHLQEGHMAVAREKGISPVTDENQIEGLIESGDIVSIDTGKDGLHFFYNVRKSRRYATPDTAKGLMLITERFQANLRRRADLPTVKIAVSSALRTSSYQNDLMKKNVNAAVVTSHCYGTSFDIFYDEYFMNPPILKRSNPISQAVLSGIRTKMGFLLGASLRRQFHSILMETLMDLQDEGYIYAILEKRQRCYHVTVLKGE